MDKDCPFCCGTGKKAHTIEIDRNVLANILIEYVNSHSYEEDYEKGLTNRTGIELPKDTKILSISEIGLHPNKPFRIIFNKCLEKKENK